MDQLKDVPAVLAPFQFGAALFAKMKNSELQSGMLRPYRGKISSNKAEKRQPRG
jgi:hypothetical protein